MLVGLALGSGSGCSSEPRAPSQPRTPFEFHDACDRDAVPDDACYASTRDPSSANVGLATEIAHRYIAEHPATELAWNWGEGVLMYAMTELYRVTGDPVVYDYYQTYVDHHLAVGYRISRADSCPPALAALALYEETGDERYEAVLEDVMHHLLAVAPRTDQGGISHLDVQFGRATLWVDSLFMFGMVLNRWGELGPDPWALDEMGAQLDIFGQLLQDPTTGLFTHAYAWPEPQDPNVYWARGNSWVLMGAVDYLRVRRLRHESDERAEQLVDDLLEGVLGTQDASGAWWTVMNRPGEAYLETSATGFFGYGMARAYRYGFAGEEVRAPLAAALEYVRGSIVRDAMDRPIVTGISRPTGVGGFDEYARVTVGQDISYGVGAAILILIETSGLVSGTSMAKLDRRFRSPSWAMTRSWNSMFA